VTPVFERIVFRIPKVFLTIFSLVVTVTFNLLTSKSIFSPLLKLHLSYKVGDILNIELWNSLPDDIVLADSLSTFQRQPNHMFQQFYPDVVLQLLPNCVNVTPLVVLEVAAAT